ncbi:MAG: sulfatase-like hydrolase/transferase [Candidatus Hydrogenedens sp.]|nr:sulfatase-like hydrolase/transferase [Candidatus Hydrogenedens sp.]
MRAFRLMALTVTILAAACAARAAEGRPNIILIMADDLGAECLESYGSASYKTPHLNRMAEEGMRFTNSHSMPLCTPSRVAIMTGKYNSRNYIAFGILDPKETTFADYLKEAGYATGIVGKWQLCDSKDAPGVEGSHPLDTGFEDYLLWHYTKRGERYADPELKQKDQDLEQHLGEYGPDLLNAFALNFIEEHKEEPFFLYYPMCLVHDPFQPTPDSDDWEDGDRKRKALKYFPDMVAYMDAMAGRVLDKVDELGLAERTLVIFTGDNGTDKDVTSRMQDGREVKGGKGSTLDTGTHVPMIVRWKGVVEAGAVNENLVSFEDILPTLVETGGATLPEDAVVDGRSFLAQLRGDKTPTREWVYVPYNPVHGSVNRLVRYAHDAEWKLYGDGRLFNKRQDPDERTPLPEDEAGDVRARLQAVLDTQP